MSYFPTSDRPPVAAERNEQAPLGENPTYDDVLDVAVQYTFPCSDPIAVDSCCAQVEQRMQREEGQPRGPGHGGHGEAVTLGEA
jgi:hypothetical protein